MPIHTTQYAATCFQLGVGFSSPLRVRKDQVKVPNIWVSIQEPVQNSPIWQSATLSVKPNGTELTISPKNALKMSVLALLKEKAQFSWSTGDLFLEERVQRKITYLWFSWESWCLSVCITRGCRFITNKAFKQQKNVSSERSILCVQRESNSFQLSLFPWLLKSAMQPIMKLFIPGNAYRK